jgi:tricorn protease interacting factor F2/3
MDKYNYIINKYNISTDIDTTNLKYTGTVKIYLEITNNINTIKINSSGLKIFLVKINCVNTELWEENKSDEYIGINYDFVKNHPYQIHIEFEGSIYEDMDGFYYCKQNNNLILCTHFEPKSARKFIPCFDEPDLKAIFIVQVTIESKYLVLSNNSVKKIINLDDGLKKKYIFNPTPKMSTYLLAVVAGDIVKVDNNELLSNNMVKINGYCIESNKNQITWSIARTKEALDFYTSWFGIDYPMEKLDIVSVPNFSSGAMENWGLITFRDEYLSLYDVENYLSKIKILEVIYHEIAHQWFGNLVTMDNWNSLWLNESTATYFSWMALEIQYPEYMVKELNWLLECKNVMTTDAMTNTHPIVMTNYDNNHNESANLTDPNDHPTDPNDQIDPMDMFDEITYSKGNLIIKYVVNLLGINNFQKSIGKYLSTNIYSNAKSTQLYSFFNEFSLNKQIDWNELMCNLTTTKGYPILYIGKENNDYNIRFKRFNLDKSLESEYPNYIWLKINYFDQDETLKSTLIKLKPGIKNKIPRYITNGKFIINPDNILFVICKYEEFIPDLEIMNQSELMKYLHEEFILSIYSYTNLSYYLNLILFVLTCIDLEKNYLLLYQVTIDLIKIIQINIFSNKNSKKIINFIKTNLRNKWINVLKKLIETKPKYHQMVIDKIFELELYLDSSQISDIICKYYTEIIKMITMINDFNTGFGSYTMDLITNCYFKKTLFTGIMKYLQNEKINEILDFLKKTSNPNIVSNIIESFSMLDDNNFDLVFSNYKNLIKSQDFDLFFFSIGKITSKQEFIIDYWFNNRAVISNIPEIQFKILKKISLNIYKINLIDKLVERINGIYLNKYRLVLGKIIDILETNKIVANNFNYSQKTNF